MPVYVAKIRVSWLDMAGSIGAFPIDWSGVCFDEFSNLLCGREESKILLNSKQDHSFRSILSYRIFLLPSTHYSHLDVTQMLTWLDFSTLSREWKSAHLELPAPCSSRSNSCRAAGSTQAHLPTFVDFLPSSASAVLLAEYPDCVSTPSDVLFDQLLIHILPEFICTNCKNDNFNNQNPFPILRNTALGAIFEPTCTVRSVGS